MNANRASTLLMLFLVFTLSQADRQILGQMAELVKSDLQLSDAQLGDLHVAFGLVYAVIGLPMAMLADRVNRRNVIVAVVVLWSTMTVWCGTAASFVQMMVGRIGVAVGEAGANPASHSLISSLFERPRRTSAMAWFALGTNVGSLIAFGVGGYVATVMGWRMAFTIFGVAGIVLAVAFLITVGEPDRGSSTHPGSTTPGSIPTPSFVDAVRILIARPAWRELVFANTLMSIAAYGLISWSAPYLQRVHGLSQADSGTLLALAFGVVGGIGTLLGGFLFDRIADTSPRRALTILAWTIAAATPFACLYLLLDAVHVAVVALFAPALAIGVYIAPSFSVNQGLSPVEIRGRAAGLMLFVGNLVGLGMQRAIGMTSDGLQSPLGADALRYALLLIPLCMLWSVCHYLRCARTVAADLVSEP